eukprot:4805128-Pyramimonas_sp.AAC.1
MKSGDEARCVAAYAKVFLKIKQGNLTHPELYVTHSNRAAAFLSLGLYEEALWDAAKCQVSDTCSVTHGQGRSNT